jgi:hypothetical protein
VKRRTGCLAIALFTVLGAVSAASVADGTYKGKVKLKGASSIVVKVRGNSLTKIGIRKLPLKCNNGTTYPENFTFAGSVTIADDGTVHTTSEGYAGARKAEIAIHFTASKAAGTISRMARFNKVGFADPAGRTQCRSGKRHFTAKRRS